MAVLDRYKPSWALYRTIYHLIAIMVPLHGLYRLIFLSTSILGYLAKVCTSYGVSRNEALAKFRFLVKAN